MDATAIVRVYDAIHDALHADAELTIVYATGGDIIKERTIKPRCIQVGTKGSDLIYADDGLRGRRLTFRIDRIVAVSARVEERS